VRSLPRELEQAGNVRALLEGVAADLGMTEGLWRLEARFENGGLLRIDRHHEKVPASVLGPPRRPTPSDM
jgi:hypothetical protein